MKLETKKILIESGEFVKTNTYRSLFNNIVDGILTVTWADNQYFIINPVYRGNGVVPIKSNFIAHLIRNGWQAEEPMPLVNGMRMGKIDAVYKSDYGNIAVEWETGNISSSHRALNKMALGIIQNHLIAGFLILPMRSLSKFLTDRVGNYEEISPYFPLYNHVQIREGALGVFGVTYDKTSENVIRIPKGQDGNAFRIRK